MARALKVGQGGLAYGFVLALALAGVCGAVQASEVGLRIEVVGSGASAGEPADTRVSAREAADARVLVEEVLQRLPPRWRGEERTLRLGWRDDLPGDVHGRILGGRIGLSRGLLEESGGAWPSGAAVRALLHELAHDWDRAQGLSRDSRLLDLAGWQVRPLWPGRSGRNDFDARSPDAYELHSPAEFVAVNLEHFLLDPGYACRRPGLHAYFAGHFGWAPEAAECGVALPFVDAGALADADAAPLLELDPARVVAVDYLLAGDGDALMSRWGHSMLRLVVCAPGREPGPECRLDLDHHRVLSFRAFVDDLQLSSWAGLTGGYPSRLFVLPLQQVVDEYAAVELRPLDSIPLRLSAAEIEALLERAARVHWSYDGRYRFIGNNCAVETWKLLHDGVPRAAEAGLDSITPKGLLRRLRRAGLVDDAKVPADLAEAVRLGFRFEPWSTHYQALYDTARESLGLEPEDVEDWLRLPPARRTPWLERADLRASAALLLLEQAALRREEQHARDMLKRMVFRLERVGGDDSGSVHAIDAGVDADADADTEARLGARIAAGDAGLPALLAAALREGGVLASPSELLSLPGYGLPQAAEREQARSGAGERAARLRELDARLHQAARDWLPLENREALEQTEENIALIGDRLRHLHHTEGGKNL